MSKTTKKSIVKKEKSQGGQNALTTQQQFTLTFEDVKKYINPLATDKEVYFFLQLCKHQNLNPFLNEVYLIKYSEKDEAKIVVSKDVLFKRANRLPAFDGIKAGIIVQKADGTIEEREGQFYLDNEKLLGGWAVVYRKDRKYPVKVSVRLQDYIGRKADGSITRFWAKMPATMISKVAKAQALREAFPEELAGMYDHSEMGVELPEERNGYEEPKPIDIKVLPQVSSQPQVQVKPQQVKEEVKEKPNQEIKEVKKETKEVEVTTDAETKKLIQKVHILWNKFAELTGKTDDDYRAYLETVFGVDSSTKLTRDQLKVFIATLSGALNQELAKQGK